MRFLLALSLVAAASAFGQTTSTCSSFEPLTANCRGSGAVQTPAYWGAAAQQQLLQQQIETQRLQTELLRKQIEIQQLLLDQQRLQLDAARDHEMRLERLQHSMVTGAPCLRSNTPDYCAARDPDLRAAKDDVASGRISEAEFIQVAQEADRQVKAQQAASP